MERPIDPVAVQIVRIALAAEKTTLIDSRMASDASQIDHEEAKRIQAGLVVAPSKGIYQVRQCRSFRIIFEFTN